MFWILAFESCLVSRSFKFMLLVTSMKLHSSIGIQKTK